jgi:hypothetical protein
MEPQFSKIEQFIAQNKILPRDCTYHTQRELPPHGKLRILVLKADNTARCEYICPNCRQYGYLETEWSRPFSFKCEHCGTLIRVPRMREAFKRELKAGK